MDCLGYIAGVAVGFVLGLYFGRLLTTVIIFWESTITAAKAYKSLITFVLGIGGVGGGTVMLKLFSGHHAVLYLLGLTLGMAITFFWHRTPSICKPDTIKLIVNLNEAMRNNVPDVEQRTNLIISAVTPPRFVEREEKISEATLAKRLEEAADAFQETGVRAEGDLNGEEAENAL